MGQQTAWRPRAIGALVAAFAVFGLAGCDPTPTVDLVVTSTADLTDATPGDGVCEATTGAGDCTLRAAVMESNASTSDVPVRIVLSVGAHHVLDRCPTGTEGAPDASVGDLDTTRSVTIIGNGATVDAGESEPTCGTRAFEHHAGDLDLRDLTVEAYATDNGAVLANHATAHLVDVIARGASNANAVVFDNEGMLTLARTRVVSLPFLDDYGFYTWFASVRSTAGSLTLLDTDVRLGSTDAAGTTVAFSGVYVAGGDASIYQSVVTAHVMYRVELGKALVFPGAGIDAQVPIRVVRSSIVGNGPDKDVVGGVNVTLTGSIVASCSSQVGSQGYNADIAGNCLDGTVATDRPAATLTWPDAQDPSALIPLPGSDTIDAIPLGTPGLCDDQWPHDLRGVSRPTGAGCDIGAYEQTVP